MYTLISNNKRISIAEKGNRKGNYFRSSFKSTFCKQLSKSISRDFVKIGQAVFAADRAFPRSTNLGGRTRMIKVIIPVENPEAWASCSKELEGVIRFVSRDWWEFEFKKSKPPPSSGTPVIPFPPDRNCVALFSDGLDSFSGAVRLFRQKNKPVFVLHSQSRWSFKKATGRIDAIKKQLAVNSEHDLAGFSYFISDKDAEGKRNGFAENSRRTRPFFYLCLASAIAFEKDIPLICLNENSTLAINLPFNKSMMGVRSISRHAHPKTLFLFENLLKKIWPGDKTSPKIINLFAEQTKAGEVAVAKKAGISDLLISETVSCENSARPLATFISLKKKEGEKVSGIKECGVCSPCIIKKYSLYFNRIKVPPRHFAFKQELLMGANKRRLKEMLGKYSLWRLNYEMQEIIYEFCRKIVQMKPREFVMEYIYELSLLNNSYKNTDDVGKHVHSLYKKFSKEYISYWNRSQQKARRK
ncbi:MAG: hypothetical protein HOP10_03065 [Chitinophagaceae bacterium]|nr:hypothetical protein [Chitinophagaceae bacterium]